MPSSVTASPHARVALQEGQPEQHRQRRDRRQQHLWGAPVERRSQQAGQPEQAGQADGVGAVVHRVQLVHADRPEREQSQREDRPALDHDEQREGDRGQGRQHAGAQIRPPVPARAASRVARSRAALRVSCSGTLAASAPAEAPAAGAELGERLLQRLAREVRPQLVAEDQLE
jgi:hypothetical protein